MKKVLLDTNALLMPVLDGVDVFDCLNALIPEAHELATTSSIVRELEGMQSPGSRRGVAARVALELVRKRKIRVYESNMKPDESIIAFALEHRDTMVFTNDGKLKKELRKSNIQVITPKGRKYLALT
jgi:rRNA-processing protein FCF1